VNLTWFSNDPGLHSVAVHDAAAATAKQASLVDLQARATQAHKTYREKARSEQQCDAQTVAANAAAAKSAMEASQRRRVLLTALASKATTVPVAPTTPGAEAEEFDKAVALLGRDLETSASLMVRADPHQRRRVRIFGASSRSSDSHSRDCLRFRSNMNSVPLRCWRPGDRTKLLNAYFSSSKLEMERACLEKTESKTDPFRVPAKATKRTRRVKR
jgi:hypothetical protein